MSGIHYTNDPRSVLIHFNPNHDPDNGQFTDKKGDVLEANLTNPAASRMIK